MHRAILIAIFLLAVATRLSGAGPGSIDPAFDPGSGIAPISAALPVRVIFPLSDGSFLLGGFFTNYNGVLRPGLAKILENGALDENFVPDLSSMAPRPEVWAITQQTDGKFIIGGISTSGSIGGRIIRLNDDGSLDPTFTFVRGTSTFVMAVNVRSDGLISYLSDNNLGIGLLNPDGSRLLTSGSSYRPFGLFSRIRASREGHTFYSFNDGLFRFGDGFGLPDDVLFNGGGGATSDFDFQSDGRIVAIATAATLRRYFPNGVLDSSFQPTFNANDIVSVICLPNDKILVGGTFTAVNGVARRNFARLNADGTLDTNFVTGAGPNSTVYTIAPVANGKALIAGKFTSYDGLSRTGVARIFLDPPAVPTFLSQPQATNLFEGQSIRLSVAVNAALPIAYRWKKDGEFIAGATNAVFYIFRARESDTGAYSVEVSTSNGAATSSDAMVTVTALPTVVGGLDPSFARGQAASRAVNAYLDLANGKSLIGGNFFAYDTHYQPALVRLNSDGSLDSSLNFNLPPNAACTSLAKLSDGKILAGFISSRSGTTNNPVLLRLNSDGSLDRAFFPDLSSDILAFAALPDGKALIGGAFSSLGGITRTRLARLNSDCTIDQSFDVNALQLTKVYSLAVQPDGKILVADERRFLRLWPDGAVETDWTLSAALTISLQPDGKILIGGQFGDVNGAPRTNLARLNADMTVDADFNPGAGVTIVTGFSAVRSIAVQPDQKIIVAGTFSKLAGSSRNNIGRLFPNGSLDDTFHPDVNLGTATTRVAINTASLADDGALTIAGLFSRVNDSTRNSLARISTTVPLPTLSAVVVQTQSGEPAIKLTFPTDSNYTLEFTDAFPALWQDYGPLPTHTNTIELPLVGSQRFYRLKRQV